MMNSKWSDCETIVAIATPAGKGGIGIVRISGNKSISIAKSILGNDIRPKQVSYRSFIDQNGEVIDKGLAILFPSPNSFTGEDVVELQGHGGPVILNNVVNTAIHYGARLARPGEFSQRAFLNEKMDLAQAEAVSDLINAHSIKAAKAAMRTLEGSFSKRINELVQQCISIRTFIEASIDFSEEEIDVINMQKIREKSAAMLSGLETILTDANHGATLNEGIYLTLAGLTNAGKSTLFNKLAGNDFAIVTNIPGTTRDVMREQILLDGMLFNLRDTAGFRQTNDLIEKEGIDRAKAEIVKSDHIIWIEDCKHVSNYKEWLMPILDGVEHKPRITILRNKVDLTGKESKIYEEKGCVIITVSAKTGQGLGLLHNHLQNIYKSSMVSEGEFIARSRHVCALNRAKQSLQALMLQLQQEKPLYELLAEDLRIGQNALSEITGEFSNEDLLGNIFSTFCIGK